jgi:hypothetical protein
MQDLNALIPPASGWELVEAFDVNEGGQIVGIGRHTGRTRAFLLSPVPGRSPTDDQERDSGHREQTAGR